MTRQTVGAEWPERPGNAVLAEKSFSAFGMNSPI